MDPRINSSLSKNLAHKTGKNTKLHSAACNCWRCHRSPSLFQLRTDKQASNLPLWPSPFDLLRYLRNCDGLRALFHFTVVQFRVRNRERGLVIERMRQRGSAINYNSPTCFPYLASSKKIVLQFKTRKLPFLLLFAVCAASILVIRKISPPFPRSMRGRFNI